MSKKGPFTHQCERGRFASDAMRWLKEPTEFKGADLGGYTGHQYAFTTPWKMMGAIDRFMILREMGFYFQELEVTEYKVLPDGQVAYNPKKATLICEAHVNEFPLENYEHLECPDE